MLKTLTNETVIARFSIGNFRNFNHYKTPHV